VSPSPVQDLRRRHVTQLEAGGDVGHGPALDSRLPQGLTFAEGEMAEYDIREIAVHDRGFDIGTAIGIASQGDQRASIPLPPSKHIKTVITGDRQQPRSGHLRGCVGLHRIRGDQEGLVSGIRPVLGIPQDASAEAGDAGEIRAI